MEVFQRTALLTGRITKAAAGGFTSSISGTSVLTWLRVPTDAVGDHGVRVAILTGDGRTIHRTQRFSSLVGLVDLCPLWRIQAGDEVAVAAGYEDELGDASLLEVISAQVVQRVETPAGGLSRVLAEGFGSLEASINARSCGTAGSPPGSAPRRMWLAPSRCRSWPAPPRGTGWPGCSGFIPGADPRRARRPKEGAHWRRASNL